MKKTRVYVAVPTTGVVCDTQSYCLRELEKKYADSIELVYPAKCVRRIFHDFARNAHVEDFLATDCDVLWFLDSDIAPAAHVLDLVAVHGDKWKVAAAPYPVFMTPAGEENPQVVFCIYNGTDGKGLSPADIPHQGTDWVDGAATGCLFIKREVLEKVSKPYFEFTYRSEDRYITMGEDIGFCKKLMDLGYRIFVDYSMVAKHYKTVCLLEVNNYATDYANKSVQRYDSMIRGQVEQLASRLKPKGPEPTGNPSKIILPKF